MPGMMPLGPGFLPGLGGLPPPGFLPLGPGGLPLGPGGVPLLLPLPPGLTLIPNNRLPDRGPKRDPDKPREPPKNPKIWPIFVGNVSFDTTEAEVQEIFDGAPGLIIFRLSMSASGVSRGFGFAEFDAPETALDAIKKLDGSEIRGRKLRLRWGENAVTTPEVDEFHKAPERYKTRPCFEGWKGGTCARGEDCPYAHADSELRSPIDLGQRMSAVVTPVPEQRDNTQKVFIPHLIFDGATEEEKRKNAFHTVLGAGACNTRDMMKKSGCRIQVRGLNGEEAKEGLHVVVKPGLGTRAVSQEQIEIVRRAIDEILEAYANRSNDNAGPSLEPRTAPILSLEGPPAVPKAAAPAAPVPSKDSEPPAQEPPSQRPPKRPAPEESHYDIPRESEAEGPVEEPPPAEPDEIPPGPDRCASGSSCVNLDCALKHPRLPGIRLPPGTETTLRFFIVKAHSLSNIQLSVRTGIWATGKSSTAVFQEAFEKSTHVVLIFSADQTGHFQGYARMASAPDPQLRPGLWGRLSPKLGDNFKVEWLKKCMLPFSRTETLRNSADNDTPVRRHSDGQEVPSELGEKLVRLLHQMRDEDLLSLPTEEDDDLFTASSAPRSDRSRSPRRESKGVTNGAWAPSPGTVPASGPPSSWLGPYGQPPPYGR